jgi:hypothetical protein
MALAPSDIKELSKLSNADLIIIKFLEREPHSRIAGELLLERERERERERENQQYAIRLAEINAKERYHGNIDRSSLTVPTTIYLN